ncbi:probable long-chain-alcohol O-fatty-acyltransferase 5 [Andrographis paniculata]|uniref:probable long-chain-alcohol O-fatty-acyltransferase 5 n=1 Tax=Andrographis paniculata TaxID=175694 RepID=UPI0021E7231E|nr:probable long-chain-alcohol O-fatty-acyltransferase 5 [Andrographis paniculata]
MDGEISNLLRLCFSLIASFTYCRLLPARLPAGKWRLISLLPIICVFMALPRYVASTFATAVMAFFFTWLANFKLLLFAFDRGPIASLPSKSFPVFIAAAAFPFTVKPQNDVVEASRKSKKLPINLTTGIPIAAALMSTVYYRRQHLHPQILMAAYCVLVFLQLEILIEISSALVRPMLGLELEPASDEPYLSISLQEFWGRRWNIATGNLLRQAVYKPVRSVTAPVLGREWSILAAVEAAFLVSGLMHELIFWYTTPAIPPSWEVTMFFVVQGVGVAVEVLLKAAIASKKCRLLTWWVSGPLTLGFVAGTSFWLFFPPLIRNGVDVRVIGEFKFAGELLKKKGLELVMLG